MSIFTMVTCCTKFQVQAIRGAPAMQACVPSVSALGLLMGARH